MRLPRVRFTVLRIMVAVVFFALIAALLAQQRSAGQREAKLQADLRYVRSIVPNSALIASVHNSGTKIDAAGDRVLIAATAEIMDRTPDPAYVWAVRLTDPSSRKVAYSMCFERRLVRPSRGQSFSTTFVEILRPPIAPGAYFVRVSLLRVPTNGDLSGLDRDEIYQSMEVISAIGKVTLRQSSDSADGIEIDDP